MMIVIVGSNLQAGVLTALLSEYGNELYTFPDPLLGTIDQDNNVKNRHYQSLQDPHLEGLLRCLFHEERFTVLASMNEMPMSVECYLLCYDPDRFEHASEFIKALPRRADGEKRLFINSGTFGLYGTKKLQALAPDDHWAYLPDTVQEGNAVNSFVKANKMIVGVENSDVKILIRELFRPFFALESQFLWMPILDAEFAKMSISGMLATRISYMNDLANVAEKMGVDIMNVKEGLASDNRIGSSYLSAGVGFGGENFSHDILLLNNVVLESGTRGRLLEQVWQINEDQKEILFRKLWHFYKADLKDKKITIWGAAFKEETSSTYNSPIHKMIEALIAQGAKIAIYDPKASVELYEQYPHYLGQEVTIFDDKYSALKESDGLCVLTAWKEFYSPDYEKMQQLMNSPLLLDGRNIYDPNFMKQKGFMYEGVGRK